MKSILIALALFASLQIVSSANDNPPATADASPLARKLDSIIIPKIEFRDLPVSDALAFLRQQAKLHDSSTNKANEKGLNFVFKLSKEHSSTVVSLELENVSLRAALRYVCTQANLKFKVEPEAILVAHVQDPVF